MAQRVAPKADPTGFLVKDGGLKSVSVMDYIKKIQDKGPLFFWHWYVAIKWDGEVCVGFVQKAVSLGNPKRTCWVCKFPECVLDVGGDTDTLEIQQLAEALALANEMGKRGPIPMFAVAE
jgi:hypothetical protein